MRIHIVLIEIPGPWQSSIALESGITKTNIDNKHVKRHSSSNTDLLLTSVSCQRIIIVCVLQIQWIEIYNLSSLAL